PPLVPLPAIHAGFWPAIARRQSPPSLLPRLRPWPRASAASGLVLATQKLDGITGRGTRGTLVGEGFEQSRGDAFPAPALDHGSPGRGAERFALLVRECQEAR